MIASFLLKWLFPVSFRWDPSNGVFASINIACQFIGNLLICWILDYDLDFPFTTCSYQCHAGAGSFSFDQLKQRASDRLHVQPLKLAADNLSIPARMLSVDVDRPSVLNNLGSPSICVVHKINHHDDSRLDGFAMAVLATVTRLKLSGTKIILSIVIILLLSTIPEAYFIEIFFALQIVWFFRPTQCGNLLLNGCFLIQKPIL